MAFQQWAAALVGGDGSGRSTSALWAVALLGLIVLSGAIVPLVATSSLGTTGAHLPLAGGVLGPRPETPAGLPAPMTIGSRIATTSPTFFGVVPQTTASGGLTGDSAIGSFLNSTPFSAFREADMSDQSNVSANVEYGSNGQVVGAAPLNLSGYKAWCSAHRPGCVTILDLPGENNNSAEDRYIANWVVHTEGFQPTYWSIGNEPELWTHYGIPWTRWSPSDSSTPSPMAYAYDLKSAIAAVRAVDPGARFVGLEADCVCTSSWFQDTAWVDGPNLSAIAFHAYPSLSSTTSETLSTFYGALASSVNLSSSYAAAQSDIRGYCSNCSSMPIWVTEYNAGPGWSPSNYAGSYANAVFLGASVAQGLLANVSDLMIFNLQSDGSGYGYSLLNSANTVGPTGLLYSGMLEHLATGAVYRPSFAGEPADVWSALTMNATTESLLVVNTNLNSGVTFGTRDVLPAGNGTIYSWQTSQSGPTAASGPVPGNLTVPSQGILLVDVPRPQVPPSPLSVAPNATPAAGIAPLNVQFSGTPVGGTAPYAIRWQFGDGSNGTGLPTNHTYTVAGNYTATESVVDADGQSVNASVPVHVFPEPEGYYVAAWSNVTAGTAPLAVAFDAVAHGGTAPYTYSWDLGNGVNASGATTATTFATPGNYTATVTVVDANGNETQAVVPVYVGSAANGLSAWALASTASGPAPLEVNLVAQANGSPVPANYTWQLETNLSAEYGPSASVTFTTPGAYPIVLTVRGAANQTVVLTMTIDVYAPLLAAISPASGTFPTGSPLELASEVQGGSGAMQYRWAVNGVLVADNGSDLNWTPPATGNYTIALIVYDDHGDRALATARVVAVAPSPITSDILGSAFGSDWFPIWGVAMASSWGLILGILVVIRIRGGDRWLHGSPRLHAVVRRSSAALHRGSQLVRRGAGHLRERILRR